MSIKHSTQLKLTDVEVTHSLNQLRAIEQKWNPEFPGFTFSTTLSPITSKAFSTVTFNGLIVVEECREWDLKPGGNIYNCDIKVRLILNPKKIDSKNLENTKPYAVTIDSFRCWDDYSFGDLDTDAPFFKFNTLNIEVAHHLDEVRVSLEGEQNDRNFENNRPQRTLRCKNIIPVKSYVEGLCQSLAYDNDAHVVLGDDTNTFGLNAVYKIEEDPSSLSYFGLNEEQISRGYKEFQSIAGFTRSTAMVRQLLDNVPKMMEIQFSASICLLLLKRTCNTIRYVDSKISSPNESYLKTWKLHSLRDTLAFLGSIPWTVARQNMTNFISDKALPQTRNVAIANIKFLDELQEFFETRPLNIVCQSHRNIHKLVMRHMDNFFTSFYPTHAVVPLHENAYSLLPDYTGPYDRVVTARLFGAIYNARDALNRNLTEEIIGNMFRSDFFSYMPYEVQHSIKKYTHNAASLLRDIAANIYQYRIGTDEQRKQIAKKTLDIIEHFHVWGEASMLGSASIFNKTNHEKGLWDAQDLEDSIAKEIDEFFYLSYSNEIDIEKYNKKLDEFLLNLEQRGDFLAPVRVNFMIHNTKKQEPRLNGEISQSNIMYSPQDWYAPAPDSLIQRIDQLEDENTQEHKAPFGLRHKTGLDTLHTMLEKHGGTLYSAVLHGQVEGFYLTLENEKLFPDEYNALVAKLRDHSQIPSHARVVMGVSSVVSDIIRSELKPLRRSCHEEMDKAFWTTIGSEMIIEALKTSEALPPVYAILYVWTENHARHIFEKMGWTYAEINHERLLFQENGSYYFVMTRQIL